VHTDQIFVEALETRRLCAAWMVNPVLPDDTGDASVSFQYVVNEAGYTWKAEVGEIGDSKLYFQGMRFEAYYDESAPSHPEDPGPDRQAFFADLERGIAAEYAASAYSNSVDVEFSVVEFEDGTFAVVGERRDLEPAPHAGPIVITEPAPAVDPPAAEPVRPSPDDAEERRAMITPDVNAVPPTLVDRPKPGAASRPSAFSTLNVNDTLASDERDDLADLATR
jgi:hypothetical protein